MPKRYTDYRGNDRPEITSCMSTVRGKRGRREGETSGRRRDETSAVPDISESVFGMHVRTPYRRGLNPIYEGRRGREEGGAEQIRWANRRHEQGISECRISARRVSVENSRQRSRDNGASGKNIVTVSSRTLVFMGVYPFSPCRDRIRCTRAQCASCRGEKLRGERGAFKLKFQGAERNEGMRNCETALFASTKLM